MKKTFTRILMVAMAVSLVACGGNKETEATGSAEGNSEVSNSMPQSVKLSVSPNASEGTSGEYVTVKGGDYTFEFTPDQYAEGKVNGVVTLSLNVAQNPNFKEGDNLFGESEIIFYDENNAPLSTSVSFKISDSKALGNAMLSGADNLTASYKCSWVAEKDAADFAAKAKSFALKVDDRLYTPGNASNNGGEGGDGDTTLEELEKVKSNISSIAGASVTGDIETDATKAAELDYAVKTAKNKEEREEAKAALDKFKNKVITYYTDKAEQKQFDEIFIAKKKELKNK